MRKGERCTGVGTGAVGEALEKRGMKVSRAKTEYMCLNGSVQDTVWMEQLEEDVRRPMRQESTTTREGKDTQDDRSASYAVLDGDSVSENLPREETGSDRNENVQMGMRPHAKRPCEKR